MKQGKASNAKAFVASLYANGKKPCERFGLTWESLSELERKVPSLTCKQDPETCKSA
ncbi:hypothetical protein [Thaumasiovibrio sp. DFM-14]|uniref:hypothetical protein n=1 Tax=Thaumasiovibrio sp. DFM-14 TaxID=3384792 RepID=UPI00399FD2DC